MTSGPGVVSTGDRIASAVFNNAVWCDAVCRALGCDTDFVTGLWINRSPSPPFDPNAATLTRDGSDAQMRRIRLMTDGGELVEMLIGGEVTEAADLCDDLGLLPKGALLRLHAARVLVSEGRASEANAPLQRAVAFWRSMGATRLIHEAEELAATFKTDVPKARVRRGSTASGKRH